MGDVEYASFDDEDTFFSFRRDERACVSSLDSQGHVASSLRRDLFEEDHRLIVLL